MDGALSTHRHIKEAALVVYLSAALLYYVRGVPVGHALNVVFLILFGLMPLFGDRRLILGNWHAVVISLCCLTALASMLSAVGRATMAGADFVRSVTWILPAAILVALVQRPRPDLARVGVLSGMAGLIGNLLLVMVYGKFDEEHVKFDIVTSWIDVSSNELSFHWMVFGAGLLLLAGRPYRRFAFVAFVLSLGHLSKAHLASSIAAVGLGALRRRILLGASVALGTVAGLIYLGQSGLLQDLRFDGPMASVFGRLRDMVVVASQLLWNDDVDLEFLATAVGGARFEVYSMSWDLVRGSPFGLPVDEVTRQLRGLDPHSNVLYLALRDGWTVAALYLISYLVIARNIAVLGMTGHMILAVVVYSVLRTLFMTYDPVRMLVVAVIFAQASHGISRLPAVDGVARRVY